LKASSTCDEYYGVNGVPHIVLIGKDGTIEYIGHPMNTQLEQDIAKLLTG